MPAPLVNYKFKFKDSQGEYYKLRAENLTACCVLYRVKGSLDSFTETHDYNLDEEDNAIWCRLPAYGPTEVAINITVEPLRNVTTGLRVLQLNEYTVEFDMVATPTPIHALEGHSPRIIEGYWHEFDDESQTFRNTGIKAEGTVIETGEVVDVVEPNNPNAVTSNAVYVSQQNINNAISEINTQVTNINQRTQVLEGKKVKVKVNDEVHEQDEQGLIDLGSISTSGTPNTRMLTRTTEIDGVLYGRGTQVGVDDNRIYSTDALYRYRLQAIADATAFKYYTLVSFNFSCVLKVRLRVYNTDKVGVIYCVKEGASWSFYSTSKAIADGCFIYMQSAEGAPKLVTHSSSPYMPRTVEIESDIPLTVINQPFGLDDESALTPIIPYLTSTSKDTITIDDNQYDVDPSELNITNYIVTVGGDVMYSLTSLPDYANDFTFAITQNNTRIVFDDTENQYESDELQAGDVVTVVYGGPGNVMFNYSKYDLAPAVDDVLIDGVSATVNRVAYINSFNEHEMEEILDLFPS